MEDKGTDASGYRIFQTPLAEQKMQAEINELNARAELFKRGVKLIDKYEEILDFTVSTMKRALED